VLDLAAQHGSDLRVKAAVAEYKAGIGFAMMVPGTVL
jgi:hypothetical protein